MSSSGVIIETKIDNMIESTKEDEGYLSITSKNSSSHGQQKIDSDNNNNNKIQRKHKSKIDKIRSMKTIILQIRARRHDQRQNLSLLPHTIILMTPSEIGNNHQKTSLPIPSTSGYDNHKENVHRDRSSSKISSRSNSSIETNTVKQLPRQ